MGLVQKAIVISLVIYTGTAVAAPKKSKVIKKNPDTDNSEDSAADDGESTYQPKWGMAGCGLWSKVIADKRRVTQLAVSGLRSGGWLSLPLILFPPAWGLSSTASSAASSDSQTSGISSGTSNCVAYRSDLSAIEKKVYITINLASLTKESAQGTGQHLDALAEIFGCPHAEFAQFSQRRYAQLYDGQEPDIVLQNYLRAVAAEPGLADACTRVG